MRRTGSSPSALCGDPPVPQFDGRGAADGDHYEGVLRHRAAASAVTSREPGSPKEAAARNSNRSKGTNGKAQKKPSSSIPIIVHLLDSLGHTNFSMLEVSSLLQCCDGCLLVVDAVKGMCARTHSHQLVLIVVVNNKINRLCTNLCLSPRRPTIY